MLIVDYKSGTPIWEQVYNGVLRLAALGVLNPGEQLPSVRSVAADAGVNPNTVQKAYAALERDGAIYSVPGRGSFLSEQNALLNGRRRKALAALQEAAQEAADAGMPLSEAVEAVRTQYEGETGKGENER